MKVSCMYTCRKGVSEGKMRGEDAQLVQFLQLWGLHPPMCFFTHKMEHRPNNEAATSQKCAFETA